MRITLTLLFVSLLTCFNLTTSIAQPDPCDTGSEDSCTCGTAEVLCTVNELDGYSFSMSDFQHPSDGPDGFCGSLTVSNNPTWFAFIAWCTDITMDVDITNCTANNGSIGAQFAVFTDCSFSTVIDCESNCVNNTSETLNLNGLTIGESYYFMVDGCSGSWCDIDISVSPTNCDEEIADWTNTDINGDLSVCAGDMVTYTVEQLEGATSYHWSIDGVEEDETSDPEFDYTWDVEGTYELCVDVSNICVEITEMPDEICETITVAAPDAGLIAVSPGPFCPGETANATVSGYNAGANYDEYLIVTDPNGEVLDVQQVGSTSLSITYDECGVVKVFSLNFANTESVPVPSVGGSYTGSDCTTFCCDESV